MGFGSLLVLRFSFAFGRARPHPGQATPHSSVESTLHPLAGRTQDEKRCSHQSRFLGFSISRIINIIRIHTRKPSRPRGRRNFYRRVRSVDVVAIISQTMSCLSKQQIYPKKTIRICLYIHLPFRLPIPIRRDNLHMPVCRLQSRILFFDTGVMDELGDARFECC